MRCGTGSKSWVSSDEYQPPEWLRRFVAGLESLKIVQGGDAHIARLLGADPHTVAKGRRCDESAQPPIGIDWACFSHKAWPISAELFATCKASVWMMPRW